MEQDHEMGCSHRVASLGIPAPKSLTVPLFRRGRTQTQQMHAESWLVLEEKLLSTSIPGVLALQKDKARAASVLSVSVGMLGPGAGLPARRRWSRSWDVLAEGPGCPLERDGRAHGWPIEVRALD